MGLLDFFRRKPEEPKPCRYCGALGEFRCPACGEYQCPDCVEKGTKSVEDMGKAPRTRVVVAGNPVAGQGIEARVEARIQALQKAAREGPGLCVPCSVEKSEPIKLKRMAQVPPAKPAPSADPLCKRCRKPLALLDMGRGGVTFGGSLPGLHDGVVCPACGALECSACKGTPVDGPCSWCGAAVSPAFDSMLRSNPRPPGAGVVPDGSDPKKVCGKCGRTEEQVLHDFEEFRKKGGVVIGSGSGLLYCDPCGKAFCGRCQVDLGMTSGCPQCRRDLD
ncbi:MAG: hypothetical protein HY823_01310 [Acidobacteria bacterium]|nr:hypothetical protein [Acidobacteriota bacterium]